MPSRNGDFHIRRQHPVLGRYVIDFFYEDLQLAIEIDGSYAHQMKSKRDKVRQEQIEATGVAFLRIPARWVLKDPDAAAEFVLSICAGKICLDDVDEKFL